MTIPALRVPISRYTREIESECQALWHTLKRQKHRTENAGVQSDFLES